MPDGGNCKLVKNRAPSLRDTSSVVEEIYGMHCKLILEPLYGLYIIRYLSGSTNVDFVHAKEQLSLKVDEKSVLKSKLGR